MAKNGTEADQAVAKKAQKYVFHKRFAVGYSLLLILLYFFNTFVLIDDAWVDQLYRWRGMEDGDARITIVEIGETSLEKVGSYPWPRDVYGKLLDKIYATGVKVVGLDILFLDASDSVRRKDGTWKLGRKDKSLVAATKKSGAKLVHAIDIDARGEAYTQRAVWEFQYPFEPLRKVAQSFGLVNQVLISDDGSVREVPIVVGTEAEARENWPTDPKREMGFGVKILSIYEGKPAEYYLEKVGGNSVWINIRGEIPGHTDFVIKEDDSLQPISIPAQHGIRRIEAWRFLEDDLDEIDKEELNGGLVLVGSTAKGAFDHYPSPFSGATPGVESHANIIDNLLNDRWLRHISGPWTYLLIILFAAAAYWLVSLPALKAGAAFAALLIAWIVATYFSFIHMYLWDFWAPALSLFGTFFVLIVHKTMLEQQQKKEVRQMFGQYVSPEIVDILVKDPGQLRLGGQKRDMTIFFLDIAHFTTISEKMTPENLINFLNTFLSELTDDIMGSSGVVDKYIGDCIMAFWNAPLEVKDHREKACLAAIACIKTIDRLNQSMEPSWPKEVKVRIGLNSGEIVVGNTGSTRKLAYTVLGDDVNLASRLEGANKFFGSTIMVSENTYEGAKEAVEARKLGRVRVVGKDIPIPVYELLTKKGELDKAWREALPLYHGAIDKYLKRNFKGAKSDLEKVHALIPGDKPTKLYLNSCEDYIVIPPPENWEGIFNLTSK